MAKISVDISANVTGANQVQEFAQSVDDAQKSVADFSKSAAADSLQQMADALREFTEYAQKAAAAFSAMGNTSLPSYQQTTPQQQTQGAGTPAAQGVPAADGSGTADALQKTLDNAVKRLSEATEAGNSKAAKEWSAAISATQAQLSKLQGDQGGGAKDGAAALTSQAKATLKDANRTLEDKLEWLTDAIDKARDKLDEAVEAQDAVATKSWGDTTAQLEEEQAKLKAQSTGGDRSAGGQQQTTGAEGKLVNYFLTQGVGNLASLAFQGMNINSSYRMAMANGDYLGAQTARERSAGDWVSMGSQLISGALALTPFAAVAPFVAGFGGAIGGGLNADANRRDAIIAEGNSYRQLFDPKYNTARLYGGAIKDETGKTTHYSGILKKADHTDAKGNLIWEDTTVDDNATWANELVRRAEKAARGTGMSITDFMNASQRYAAGGITDAGTAFELTRKAAQWSNSTGASSDNLMKLQTLSAQYGLGSNVIGTAYGALRSSGMQRGQFDEFLSGLQQVIEDGIANGFVKSAEDVAAELSIFARLSGNDPLWQGQNGVNMMQQMNRGLAGATAMQTTEQVAAVSVAKDVLENYKAGLRESGLSEEEINKQVSEHFKITATGGWTDYMQMLESGNGEVLWGVLQDIRKTNGTNSDAGITQIKNLFGVDTKRAAELWDMVGKGGEWSKLKDDEQKKIEAAGGIRLDEETEATQWQDELNKIAVAMNELTQWSFNDALDELKKIEENTRKELEDRRNRKSKEELEEAWNDFMDEQQANHRDVTAAEVGVNIGGTAQQSGELFVDNFYKQSATVSKRLSDFVQGENTPESIKKGFAEKKDEEFMQKFENFVYGTGTQKKGVDWIDDMIWEAIKERGDTNGDKVISEQEVLTMLSKLFLNGDFMYYYNNAVNYDRKALETTIIHAINNAAPTVVTEG